MSIAAVLEVEHDPPPPLRAVRDHESPGSARAPDATTAAARTVLIVEDEPGLRDSLSEILRLQGYETAEAEDGEVALQILRSRDVDVLILDLHLPKLDGVGVLRRIDAPPPMVIVHSAFEFYSSDAIGEEVGPKVFRMVRKPLPPTQLIAAVSEAVTELENLEK
ncbi:MAG TPA: response regulator [Acidimicrobiales bacterium]|nr:response regulator [Acidimicrobiales bacterium]